MCKIFVQEEFLNVTENYVFGDTGVYASKFETVREVFKFALSEYGRCTGSIYLDTPEGTKKIGWSFMKRVTYSDSKETFVREVWITLHTAESEKSITYSPMCL